MNKLLQGRFKVAAWSGGARLGSGPAGHGAMISRRDTGGIRKHTAFPCLFQRNTNHLNDPMISNLHRRTLYLAMLCETQP